MNRFLLLFFLVFCFHAKGSFQQATTQKDSLALSKANGYLKELRTAYRNGYYQKHKVYSDSLYLISKEKRLTKYQILGMVNQAVYYNNSGQQDKSIRLYRDALTLVDTTPEDYRTKIIVLVNLGNVYTTIVTALSNISDSYLKNKAYTKAKAHIEKALSFEQAQKSTKQRAWLLINLGVSELGIGNTTKSIPYLKEAQELAASKGLLKIEMEAYKHLSEAYKTNNDQDNMGLATEKFLSLQNKILENRQNATKVDFEEDLSAKNKIIESKESVISGLLKNKNRLLLWSGAIVSILALVSLLFFVNLKRFKKEKGLLQEQFIILRDSYQNQSESSFSDYPDDTKTKMAIYKNSSLTEEDFTKYKAQLLGYMTEQKPYLNNDLSQSDLASQLNISSHHLSEVLNSGFNQNFYNFINSYRVLEAQRLMGKDLLSIEFLKRIQEPLLQNIRKILLHNACKQ